MKPEKVYLFPSNAFQTDLKVQTRAVRWRRLVFEPYLSHKLREKEMFCEPEHVIRMIDESRRSKPTHYTGRERQLPDEELSICHKHVYF